VRNAARFRQREKWCEEGDLNPRGQTDEVDSDEDENENEPRD